MNAFQNAHNFAINNSQFNSFQTNISNNRSGIDILLEASIPDATYDSAARHPPPSCFPGTREQYVEDITHWAESSFGAKPRHPIYWMRGPAGVGKSAIAQTCVEKLQDMGQLGAALFFSVNGRDDHTRLFTSIAYQLTTQFDDYREIVDRAISVDKTIVRKTMMSQFKHLIADPLRELERRGRGVPPKAIFIDGLDECKRKDAQCEIIEIIAASVRNHTTPFRWAFFSRLEVHIEATFSKVEIEPLCHLTFLPISCDVDDEIELYLRNGFANIIRGHNLPIPLPWPSDQQLGALVDAAAGLFIYAATILRFVDQYSLDPEEPLHAILGIISHSSQNALANASERSAFAELDMFYQLILQRIPSHTFPSVQLLLALLLLNPYNNSFDAILLSNLLGFSKTKFWAVCNQLLAVLHCQRPLASKDATTVLILPQPGAHIDLSSYLFVEGMIFVYHKSFYDFLQDPARSGSFCMSTQQAKENLFRHLLRLHHDISDTYEIRGSELVLASHVSNSAASLSWSCDSEPIDSHIKLWIYDFATSKLIYPHSISDMSTSLLHQLRDVDYYKMFVAQLFLYRDCEHDPLGVVVLRCNGVCRKVGDTLFYCIPPEEFDKFDVSSFYQMVELYQELEIIRPYKPGSIPAPVSTSQGRPRKGLYVYGHGDKQHYWYWEFDTNHQCYYEFETASPNEAWRLFRENKFELSFFEIDTSEEELYFC